MKKPKNPEWVARGKTIRQLIKELNSFENQYLEVRISLDGGNTHACISLIAKGFGEDGKEYCVILNSESVQDD